MLHLRFVPGRQQAVPEVLRIGQVPLPVGVGFCVQPFGMPEFIAHKVQIASIGRRQRDEPHESVKGQTTRHVPVVRKNRHVAVHAIAEQPPYHGVIAIDALIVTLHIADGAVIRAIVGHFVPQAAHVARLFNAFGPVVGYAHGKAVVKAKPTVLRRAGQTRHARKLFRNGKGGGAKLMGKRVGEAQVQFAVLVGARQAHTVIKAMADVDEIVIPAVIAIQDVAHGIKAKAVNPEFFNVARDAEPDSKINGWNKDLYSNDSNKVRFLIGLEKWASDVQDRMDKALDKDPAAFLDMSSFGSFF